MSIAKRAADPSWVKALCPCCGSDVVCNSYRVGGRGYETYWECVSTLDTPEGRTCDYRLLFPLNSAPVVLGAARLS